MAFTASTSAYDSKRDPPLGLHIHLGPNASQKIANVIEDLERDAIAPIEIICRRAEA
jgi:hypothetical protein